MKVIQRGLDRHLNLGRTGKHVLLLVEDQVYVLQILQSISRDNLQRMNSILKVGILATGSAVVFLAVIILISGVPTLPASI